ncbi:unnamed protein product [Durusdinium trenchii]|uniref:Uncharacterized protein n=1 Tax=Durusdinium trenchii TaxID=1381693 RepID=A0ABP0KFF1_9DINO
MALEAVEGDAALEALAELLYEKVEETEEIAVYLDTDQKDGYIEELTSFVTKLFEDEGGPPRLVSPWITEDVGNAICTLLLESDSNLQDPSSFQVLYENLLQPHCRLLKECINECRAEPEKKEELEQRGATDYEEIRTDSFDLLEMPRQTAADLQSAWEHFIHCYESTEVAGEALYDAICESSPAVSLLFKTPRTVTAMRLNEGIHQIINSLNEPQDVKNLVDMLGFRHLELDVTTSRVEIVRNAIVELLSNELGHHFGTAARNGLFQVLNYVGGALIYIRSNYADRVRILSESWVVANEDRKACKKAEKEAREKAQQEAEALKQKERNVEVEKDPEAIAEEETHQARIQKRKKDKEQNVPRTFYDMFCFNAAVMDLLEDWMYEVLDCFDTIVVNAGNTFRLQEECDVLTLKMAKMPQPITLSDFKAVMLASLRSLIPKDWSASHEAAWSWLWQNVEHLLQQQLGKPQQRERLLGRFFASIDQERRDAICLTLYGRFFQLVPAGQDHFKQSASRLALIANRVLDMSFEVIKYPYRMVDEISALGLRHVGYAVPIEYFGPFVSAAMETLETEAKAPEEVMDSFSWSLGLISRMLVRTIKEGSTIVMKAINQNSRELLSTSLACAPRGKRCEWVLTISVGTQSISPLMWAIDSGTWTAAEHIIEDLLTIRADREKYYYGLDHLFERHPDIVEILGTRATVLLTPLFNGMVWRSHLAHNGMRRANYYIKHLVVNKDGKFPDALHSMVELQDPSIAVHPFLMHLTEIIWTGVIRPKFVFGNTWLCFNLIVFVFGHGILNHAEDQAYFSSRVAMFTCRCIIYFFGMTNLIYGRVRHIYQAIRDKDLVIIGRIPIPKRYFDNWREPASLILVIALIISFFIEPILYCLQHYEGDFQGAGLFTDLCPEAEIMREIYSVLSMFIIGLYMALLLDLATLSAKFSAYVLVVINTLPEVLLMLASLAFFILMFATCIAVSENDVQSFQDFPMVVLRLFQFAIRINGHDELQDIMQSPVLSLGLGAFLVVLILGTFSIFVAQLTCVHEEIYSSMVGYASLRRMQIEVDYMQTLRRKTWKKFVQGLAMDEPLEFGEGDIGLPGGVQIEEPAKLHPLHRETIMRYGGTTSPDEPWPETYSSHETEDEKLERMMKKFQRALAKVAKKTLKTSKLGSGFTGLSSMSFGQSFNKSRNSDDNDSLSGHSAAG